MQYRNRELQIVKHAAIGDTYQINRNNENLQTIYYITH